MNDFTASNDIRIKKTAHMWAYAANGSDYFSEIQGFTVGSPLEQAMRAFFQAEEDERLGRWRWPEEPDYVVYPAANGCLVLLELTGDTFFLHRDFLEGEDEPTRAARAYFAAHPDPDPWHDAKPGEVWLLTIDGEELAATAMEDPHGTFGGLSFLTAPRGAFGREATAITAGRRLWPEVSS